MRGYDVYDTLEARDPAEREAALMAALPAQVAHAQSSSPGYTELLAGVRAEAVTSRAALARSACRITRFTAKCRIGCKPSRASRQAFARVVIWRAARAITSETTVCVSSSA